MALKKGDKAPAFTLRGQDNETISLEDFQGRRILLSFHPLAWTLVCSEQMKALETHVAKFDDLNTVPIGISVDTVPSKKAWAANLGIRSVRLLSDFWPHGDIAKKYGVFREATGISERANIIIDQKQKIKWIKIYETSQLPDIEEILKILKKK